MRHLLGRALSFFNKSKSSDGESVVSNVIGKISLIHAAMAAAPVVIIFVLFITLVSLFGYNLNVLRYVDPGNTSSSSKVGVAIYDEATLEEYYNLSQASYESDDIPKNDLAKSEYKNVGNFNQFIKNTVCKAGFGTREGVVAAGMSLIGDYIKSTGKRIRYDQGARQASDTEGIVNENFYLDCSGFSWWALYNGGFNLPCYGQTASIYDWAAGYGNTLKSDVTQGQPGDFLDIPNSHIVLIVGKYDGGYYVAEEAGWGTGGIINKRSFDAIGSYSLVDMSKFYADSNNIRSGSAC